VPGECDQPVITTQVIAFIQAMPYRRVMTEVLTHDEFGDVLRFWRRRRSHSQLDLASAAGVSQRHISFLETGRSRPSREMVMHLGLVLDMTLRDRNAMLIAAGFAPVFPERSIDDPALADIRRALDTMLEAHDPFPAYVVDRHWNLVMANQAAGHLIAALPPAAHEHATNMAHLVLHPNGLRTVARNWDVIAASALLRLEREADESPADHEFTALLDLVRSYPGLPSDRARSRVPSAHELLLPVEVTLDDQELSLFTTIATLGSPADITLQELKLETLLPADRVTEAALYAMRDSAAC